MAGIPPVQPSNAQLEDMCERSRVTRRLSQVEGDLETVTRQLTELQRSREVRETSILVPLSSVYAIFTENCRREQAAKDRGGKIPNGNFTTQDLCNYLYLHTDTHYLTVSKKHT